eukprot:3594490-Rhodomonas_salina.4
MAYHATCASRCSAQFARAFSIWYHRSTVGQYQTSRMRPVGRMRCQYRTWRRPYATSVPESAAECPPYKRAVGPYAKSVPGIAYHAGTQISQEQTAQPLGTRIRAYAHGIEIHAGACCQDTHKSAVLRYVLLGVGLRRHIPREQAVTVGLFFQNIASG